MRTVTIELEEYNELLQDKKDKERLIKELEADVEARGFYVKKILYACVMGDNDYSLPKEVATLTILTKEEVLAEAQKEIDRLSKLSKMLSDKVEILTKENDKLKGKRFFTKLFK